MHHGAYYIDNIPIYPELISQQYIGTITQYEEHITRVISLKWRVSLALPCAILTEIYVITSPWTETGTWHNCRNSSVSRRFLIGLDRFRNVSVLLSEEHDTDNDFCSWPISISVWPQLNGSLDRTMTDLKFWYWSILPHHFRVSAIQQVLSQIPAKWFEDRFHLYWVQCCCCCCCCTKHSHTRIYIYIYIYTVNFLY